jgi:hypothetical protein
MLNGEFLFDSGWPPVDSSPALSEFEHVEPRKQAAETAGAGAELAAGDVVALVAITPLPAIGGAALQAILSISPQPGAVRGAAAFKNK